MKLLTARILFIFLLFSLFSSLKSQEDARYVWVNDSGDGIQQYLYFRNEFNLSTSDAQATIHIYAFSHYALYVNGIYINFGPIRSYPQHPYYDSYKLSSYFKKGKNIVTVKVMNNFIETFQLPSHTGAFIAWGEVKESGKTSASFATPGNWLCRKAVGFLSETPRFSFAKAGIEIYDARNEPDNSISETIDKKNWQKPTLLKNQRAFGKLLERTIPPLTQDTYTPKFVLNRITYKPEVIYSHQEVQFDTLHLRNRNTPNGMCMYTWIYSPKNQTVKSSLSWGDYYLNGMKMENGKSISPFRTEFDLSFKEGWNYFSGIVSNAFGSYDFIFSPEKTASLHLSVEKKTSGNETIRISERKIINRKEFESANFHSSPKNAKNIAENWSVKPAKNSSSSNPIKLVSWKQVKSIDPIPYFQVSDIKIPKSSEQAIVYDMGQMMLGRIFIDVDAPAGTIFDITFSEDERNDLVTLYKRNQINAGLRFISDGKTTRFESFKPYGARFLQVFVSGQTEDVVLKNVGIVSQIYPFKKTGSFECSDPLMNSIWEMGWRTLRVCAEDSYTDTPFRERGHYAGDLFPQYAITAVTSGDVLLLKHTIRVIADQYEKAYRHEVTTPYEDYPLINFLIASWYIRQYNDLDFAREIYDRFSYFMDKYWEIRNADGLFHPERTFFEWIQIDKTAALTGFQTLMKAGYDDLADLSARLGNTSNQNKYSKYASKLTEAINNKLWNAEKGIYYDGYNDTGFLTTAFPNSSAFPMIWDVADRKKTESAMDFIVESYLNPGAPINRRQLSSPYGGFYGLAALYKNEQAEVAEQYIRRHWGKMIYESDDTAWEDFNQDNHSTLSHAWSGSPTYYLSTQVLGVDLGFPSALSTDTIHIQPQAESITWAKGNVPHPKGIIKVEWKVENEILVLNYETPDNIPVVVQPKGKLSKYELIVNKK